jgi:hypothetical protein
MNRKYQLLFAVGALSIAGASMANLAVADEPVQSAAASTATFSALDADKDGRISPSEASADPKIADQFVAADTNKDGYLDPAEFQALSKS